MSGDLEKSDRNNRVMSQQQRERVEAGLEAVVEGEDDIITSEADSEGELIVPAPQRKVLFLFLFFV